MNVLFKSAMLSMVLAAPMANVAHAMGSKAPSNPAPKPTPTPPAQNADVIIDLGLNLAITYAKMDPRYATILAALGINNAQDFKDFINFNGDGTNFRNVIARLAFLQAQSDPKTKAALAQLGITDEASLRAFLASQSGTSAFDMVLGVALQQALSNPKYAVWTQRLGVKDIQDLKNLLKGNGQSGNLMNLVLVIGLAYVEANPKYAQYVPLIQAAMTTLGLGNGGVGVGVPDSSDDDIIDLGAFGGMTVGEVKAVRGVK